MNALKRFVGIQFIQKKPACIAADGPWSVVTAYSLLGMSGSSTASVAWIQYALPMLIL